MEHRIIDGIDHIYPKRTDEPYALPLTKSKWTHADLNNQEVEFSGAWDKDGEMNSFAGIGTFLARKIPGYDGLYLEIMVSYDYWLRLTQEHVNRIEVHPQAGQGTPQKPNFRMLM